MQSILSILTGRCGLASCSATAAAARAAAIAVRNRRFAGLARSAGWYYTTRSMQGAADSAAATRARWRRDGYGSTITGISSACGRSVARHSISPTHQQHDGTVNNRRHDNQPGLHGCSSLFTGSTATSSDH